MREHDRARRDRLLANCERVFDAAMQAGRLEPALGALNAETALAGLLLRTGRASPAQRLLPADADDPPGAIGPKPRGKL